MVKENGINRCKKCTGANGECYDVKKLFLLLTCIQKGVETNQISFKAFFWLKENGEHQEIFEGI